MKPIYAEMSSGFKTLRVLLGIYGLRMAKAPFLCSFWTSKRVNDGPSILMISAFSL